MTRRRRGSSGRGPGSWPAVALALALGCGAPDPPGEVREPNPLLAPPVDSARVGSADEALAWAYRREAEADLDGDGRPERLTLASDVVVGAGDKPLWEDGHRWALFATSPDSQRTLLYAAFVPRGFAEAAILVADDRGRRRVLVQERTPERVRALEVEYEGPGRAHSSSAAHYSIERWLPGSAALP